MPGGAMIVIDALVDWKAPFNARYGPSAHLMSTLPGNAGTEELEAFVQRARIPGRPHHPGTWREHYDVVAPWHEMAIEAGAVVLDRTALVQVLRARREVMGREPSP